MSSQIFNGRLDPRFNPFDDDYLVEILEATVVAWARMKQPDSSEIEDHITYRLAGRLANDPHFAELPYDIVPQCWLLGLDGERLGRLDLRFKHRHSQRDYFAFESKRFGKKISATRPTAMIARRRYIDTVPKTLFSTVVFVRRYSHHDTVRAITRAITTAHTLFVIACLTSYSAGRP